MKKKRKERKFEWEKHWELTRHHIIPRSKGGSDHKDNILFIPFVFHHAWHLLFGNATPEEAIEMIKKYWSRPNDYWINIYKNKIKGGD